MISSSALAAPTSAKRVTTGWQTHPGEAVGYILAGTVEMNIAGQSSLTLHAGVPSLMPPGTPPNAVDLGRGTGRLLSTTSSTPANGASDTIETLRIIDVIRNSAHSRNNPS